MQNLIAIYDFQLLPYALGDVLTWNVRIAMQCHESKRQYADIYISLDEESPANIYQQGLINKDNCQLFFGELYPVFTTSPILGNIFIFSNRRELVSHLVTKTKEDALNKKTIDDYLSIVAHCKNSSSVKGCLVKALKKITPTGMIKGILEKSKNTPVLYKLKEKINEDENILKNYFKEYTYSHEKINSFFYENGYIPQLSSVPGYMPDIDELLHKRFKKKKIVLFHLRLRRLDVGYGGEHTFSRDSSFLEWYEFLKKSGDLYPNVQFIALGRLQEKPLKILHLPNVTSIRFLGMDLGHELTLMSRSDLFIGSSSGFAAFANFTNIPYYITHMNPGSCDAYAIPAGTASLPFASPDQKLIYEKETSALLFRLLKEGLQLPEHPIEQTEPERKDPVEIRVEDWVNDQTKTYNPNRTTSRLYETTETCENEVAYLILPYLTAIKRYLLDEEIDSATSLLAKLASQFEDICVRMSQYLVIKGYHSFLRNDLCKMKECLQQLEKINANKKLRKLLSLMNSSIIDKEKSGVCIEKNAGVKKIFIEILNESVTKELA